MDEENELVIDDWLLTIDDLKAKRLGVFSNNN
jgi:hypothetical protein